MKIGIVGNGVVGNATGKAFESRTVLCRECGGTGSVPLSREPCSTAIIDCPKCDGKGKIMEKLHEVRYYDRVPERSTNNIYQVVSCDIVFVCLPTPQMGEFLRCDTEWVEGFFSEMVDRDRHDWEEGRIANYVLRSTVPVGFTRKLAVKYNLPNLVHSPEFLTARTAVPDAANPRQLLIGKPEWDHYSSCMETLKELYSTRWPDVPLKLMSSDETETIKLSQNAFSAVKIAFFNELRTLVDSYGLDWETVREGLLAGGWINENHTRVPGPDGKRGFDGACLPKDLANFISCLRDAGLEDNVSFAAHTRNKKDRER